MEYTTPFVHMIKTPRGHYCYDVNTNQVIRVNEGVYNYLEALEQGKDPGQPEPQVQRKLDQLKGRGLLKTKRPKKMEHPATGQVEYLLDHCLESMTLQLTQECNFRCDYCLYTTNDFERQRSRTSKKMSWETAKNAIDFLVGHSVKSKTVGIGFYGGEPLLEFNLLKKVVVYVEEAMKGKEIIFNMTTNGSLLNEEIIEFLEKHNFSLLISMDGDKEQHNRSRRYLKNGKGTYSVVEKKVREIAKNHSAYLPKVQINAVADQRFALIPVYDWFSKHEPFSQMGVQIMPIDDSAGIQHAVVSDQYAIDRNITEFKVCMSKLGRYPKNKTYDMAAMDLKRRKGQWSETMRVENELPDALSHGGPCLPGKTRLLVTVDGSFYPCERVSETSDCMKIGDIKKGFNIGQIRDLLNIGRLSEEKCCNCWAILHCSQCARACDNMGELCGELKCSHCQNTRSGVNDALLAFIFSQEFMIEI